MPLSIRESGKSPQNLARVDEFRRFIISNCQPVSAWKGVLKPIRFRRVYDTRAANLADGSRGITGGSHIRPFADDHPLTFTPE